jgi:hypothetical protein
MRAVLPASHTFPLPSLIQTETASKGFGRLEDSQFNFDHGNEVVFFIVFSIFIQLS